MPDLRDKLSTGTPDFYYILLPMLLSAKSYDTPIRIWQVLSNENARLVDLSDVMFGLSDYLCSFRAGHFTPNVRPGQTHCERIVQELIQQYQQLSSQKLSEQLNF